MGKALSSKLNNRITIETVDEQQDGYGQIVKTWRKLATVWADVRFSGGAEYQRNQVDYGDCVASVRIRMRRDVSNAARIVVHDYGDMLMAVEAVQPNIQNRAYLDLVCRAGKNLGE